MHEAGLVEADEGDEQADAMVMPCLRASGIAFMIISRRPVTTRSMMTTPYITHMPIACGQVISGATWEARTPETDSPAARASGTLPTKPSAGC